MYLVELFLPLSDNHGKPFPQERFQAISRELTEEFGGVTSFGRAPAHGTFHEGGEVVHDDIVVFEVMMEALNRAWWQNYRLKLESRFRQDEILIRVTETERI